MAFVRIHDVGHAAAVLLDGSHDLLGLGLFHARIIRALPNQQRANDFVRKI